MVKKIRHADIKNTLGFSGTEKIELFDDTATDVNSKCVIYKYDYTDNVLKMLTGSGGSLDECNEATMTEIDLSSPGTIKKVRFHGDTSSGISPTKVTISVQIENTAHGSIQSTVSLRNDAVAP